MVLEVPQKKKKKRRKKSGTRKDFFFFFLRSDNRFFAILISDGLVIAMAVVSLKIMQLTLKGYMKKFVNNI